MVRGQDEPPGAGALGGGTRVPISVYGQGASARIVEDVVSERGNFHVLTVVADAPGLCSDRRGQRALRLLYHYLSETAHLRYFVDNRAVQVVGDAFDHGPEGLRDLLASLPALYSVDEDEVEVRRAAGAGLAFYAACAEAEGLTITSPWPDRAATSDAARARGSC